MSKSPEAAAKEWKLQALITERIGMEQENAARIAQGMSLAYPIERFYELVRRMEKEAGKRDPYWTPSERAGLKAMGFLCRAYVGFPVRVIAVSMIRAYVQAARWVKKAGK